MEVLLSKRCTAGCYDTLDESPLHRTIFVQGYARDAERVFYAKCMHVVDPN